MGLLTRLVRGDLQASDGGFASAAPDSDYWYTARGSITPAGVTLDAEGARKLSAWYRGRDLLATSLAMLPLQVFERLPNDQGPSAARAHPLYEVLHTKPTAWQDSFGWRRQLMGHLIDCGNAYCRIVPGARGFVHELRPIAPRLVTPLQLSSGAVVYDIRDPQTQAVTRVGQEDIFHLRGPSDDGIVGKGVLTYAKDNLGLAAVVERYAGLTFGKGVLSGGTIENPGLLNDDASKRMAQSFLTAADNYHLPKVLEQGSKWVPNETTPEDFQMILSRKFSVTDIARWLGVPPHMIGDLEKATFSNIEAQGQDFVTYSLGPWLSLWEFACTDQLVLNPSRFYVEFQRDALVRGDLAARWAAYQIAVSTGTYTRNEVRRMENKRALDGLDTPLDPAFLVGKQPSPPVTKPSAQAEAIVIESAARVLRKEIKAITALALRHAKDGDAFAVALTDFYATHAALVSQTLHVSDVDAVAYCAEQARQGLDDWAAAVAVWGTAAYAEQMAALALTGDCDGQ